MSPVNQLIAVDRSQGFALGSESRFPLDLTSTRPEVWTAYEKALDEAWDPEDEDRWAEFDPSPFTSEQRQAAALVWSHRAWVDHAAMAESEAVLVRACLEPGISADFKYCVGLRAVERARSVDLSYMVASRLDRYHEGPASSELANLLNDDLVRRALHAKSDFGAYVAAHLVAQGTIDVRSWERALLHEAAGLGTLGGLVVRDKARMVKVAWAQLAEMATSADDAARTEMAATTAHVLFDEEGRGRQLPALLTTAAPEPLVEAHEIAAAAGLGGLSSATQREVFDAAVGEVTDRMAELGIDLTAQGAQQS